MGELRVRRLVGAEILDRLPDLARLRIAVFREFPYLYEGNAEYERGYIRTYSDSRNAVLIAAFDGDKIVGASTALPMAESMEECIVPFRAAGYDIAKIFYFGESVLLPEYRGRGVGVKFFEEREAAALAQGAFEITTFCAVERPADHPKRPPDYVPLDRFWTRRGYTRHPELRTAFSWREIGETRKTTNPLVFWLKRHAP